MMKVIVVTQPFFFEKEIQKIHTLFEDGLELLHIRKPNDTNDDIVKLVNEIDQKWHSKIIVSYSYGLEKLKVKGFHFNKKNRVQNQSMIQKILDKKKMITTSIHCPNEIEELNFEYDLVFVSPVFKSISKPNYKPFIDWNVNQINYLPKKLVALGGIVTENIEKVKHKGFVNIAILGAIWNQNQLINEFIKCLKKDYL